MFTYWDLSGTKKIPNESNWQAVGYEYECKGMAEDTGSETGKTSVASITRTGTQSGLPSILQKYSSPVLVAIIAASIIGFWGDWWTRRDTINSLIFRIERLESDYIDFKAKGKRFSEGDWEKFIKHQWFPLIEEHRKLRDEVIAHDKEAERYKQMIEEIYKRNN